MNAPALDVTTSPSSPLIGQRIAFIGGGNMASAILGALLQAGCRATDITVVDPGEDARARLQVRFGVPTLAAADARLGGSRLVVWAVKPQKFREAARAAAPFLDGALHVSVAAGIRCASMQAWLGSARIVRTMPNTPALVGLGMTGVYALPGVTTEDRALTEALLAGTGRWVWVDEEAALDAVTALSGSGPAYVFYFLEAMRESGAAMGLPPAVALELAICTFIGAAQLARQAGEPPEVLRERVTSKGGTTAAAMAVLEEAGVKRAFGAAMQAAWRRAQELGDAYGA
jgi:pyrroline-5-carboxylate reductase